MSGNFSTTVFPTLLSILGGSEPCANRMKAWKVASMSMASNCYSDINTHTHTHTHPHTHTHIHSPKGHIVAPHTHTCVHTYTHMQVYSHTHTHTHNQTHTHN